MLNFYFGKPSIYLLYAWFCHALFVNVNCLEDYELDLYDLVEEVNGTFYEFLGLDKDCTTSDIRRAYRKLSLVLHPDKNKNDDAEERFRQLAGIYDILRTDGKRSRYDEILVNGLPTWRQPIYYYRKVRKFGFTESALVLLIIVSVIHYAMIWAAFWEKRYEIEEVFQRRMKKDTKRRNHQEYNESLEEAMAKELESVTKPRLSHLLVCRLVTFTVRTVIDLPSNIGWCLSALHQRVKPPVGEAESEDETNQESKKKVRCDDVFSNMSAPEMATYIKPVVYQDTPLPAVSPPEAKKPTAQAKKTHWTDADYSKLARAMQKFPVGTQMRWEKIAQQLNCLPAEAHSRASQISRANQLQQKPASSSATALPEIKNKGAGYKPQGGISYRVEDPEASNSAPSQPVSDWTQVQQKCLENALASVPKTADDRWEEIANLVPNKTKAECIARYKHLATVIKQRKLLNTNS